MSRRSVIFGDKKKTQKMWFLQKNTQQKVIKRGDIGINKILVSKEEPYGSKVSLYNFIKYNDDDVIRPLCIKLSQMIGYVRSFES